MLSYESAVFGPEFLSVLSVPLWCPAFYARSLIAAFSIHYPPSTPPDPRSTIHDPRPTIHAPRVSLSSLTIAGFLDPALGKKSRRNGNPEGDYASIVTVGLDASGYLYVLDVWLQRVPPSEQASHIFNLHKEWNYRVFGIGANCFQALLLDPIERERERRRDTHQPWQVPISPVTHTQNKELRIATLEPLLVNGWLRLDAALPERFWQQLEAFPNADHDDALDALEGAVTLVRSLQQLPAQRPKRFPRESIQGMAYY